MEQTHTLKTTKLDELETAGFIVISTKGTSMQPLLHTYSSHVLIRKAEGGFKKNDVVLYVRPDGIQVLHRIIGFEGNTALIRGDNTFVTEHVPFSAIKGVMETVWRGKREIHTEDFLYRLYVNFWNFIYPLRFLKHKANVGVMKTGRLLLGDTSLAWVVKMVRGSLSGIALLTLCTGLTAFFSVILAVVMRNAIDYAVSLNSAMFLKWCGIFLGIVIVQLIIHGVIRQQDESIRASVENRLKERTYGNILKSSYSGLKTYHTGELQNRMTGDVKIVADYAVDLIPGVTSMAVQLVCALVILMILDIRFGCLFLTGGVVMLGVTFLFRRKMKNLHRRVQEADGRLRSWLQESVESILILKSFEAEKNGSLQNRGKGRSSQKSQNEKKNVFKYM
ncbi:MAG: hypothetical protein LUD81_05675 [Clostridiales bacterium]|nr:hypothetical protein [Clostridiales bacterium]